MKNNHETSKYVISILAILGLMFIAITAIAYTCAIFNIDIDSHATLIKTLLIVLLIGGTFIISNEMDKISK